MLAISKSTTDHFSSKTRQKETFVIFFRPSLSLIIFIITNFCITILQTNIETGAVVVGVPKNLSGSVGKWIRKAKSCNIAFPTENLYVCGWLWIFLSVSPTLKILFQLRTTLLTSTRIFIRSLRLLS